MLPVDPTYAFPLNTFTPSIEHASPHLEYPVVQNFSMASQYDITVNHYTSPLPVGYSAQPRAENTDHQEESSHAGVHLLAHPNGTGLDWSSATQLLLRNFADPQRLGIFTILPPLNSGTVTDILLDRYSDQGPSSLSMVVLYALIAIGLELELGSSLMEPMSHNELVIDSLRIEALNRIPVLTWKSKDIQLNQAMILLLFSHIWAMKADLVDVAPRWNSLATIIWADQRRKSSSLSARTISR
jgi:hypothetical protein